MSSETATPPLILIIDDERTIRDSFRNFLEDYEYRVLDAANGALGLEVFFRHTPDLVLVDLRMPGMDGLEVLKRIKEQSPDTQVIIISGTGVVGDVVRALRHGAFDYLYKPIEDLNVLLYAVEKALLHTRLVRENRAYQEHLEEEVAKRTQQLQKTTEALMESESQFRNLVEQSPISVMICTAGGQLTAVNKAWEDLWNRRREDAIDKINLYSEPIFTQMGLQQPPRSINQGEFLFVPEIEIPAKNNPRQKKYIHTYLYTIENRKGDIQNIVIMNEDITDRKMAEDEKKKLQDQLIQVQKMEAIGSLAGGIAHDFNNLLTVINGHAELSLRKTEEDNPLRRDLFAIHQAGKRAENLTRQLLTFSRKQITQLRIIDLNQVILNLEKILNRLINEDIRLTLRFRITHPMVRADPGQIEQILMNLVINAKDAVEENNAPGREKSITIETCRMDLDDSFISQHSGGVMGPHVKLTVSDTGVGMNEETMNKIFEPFFTTKSVGKGTGLGLSTVYGIVKQNNACIDVSSQPGQGASFSIYWPLEKSSQAYDDDTPAAAIDINGSETILLVEDDESVRKFAIRALKDLGYEAIEAVNGVHALEILDKRQWKLDLMITDLVMPELDGKGLAEQVKKRLPYLPILFTTGYIDASLTELDDPEHGKFFFHKPYSYLELGIKLREILHCLRR